MWEFNIEQVGLVIGAFCNAVSNSLASNVTDVIIILLSFKLYKIMWEFIIEQVGLVIGACRDTGSNFIAYQFDNSFYRVLNSKEAHESLTLNK